MPSPQGRATSSCVLWPSTGSIDRLRRIGGQSVCVLIELAGHALRLVDPRQGDVQSFRILLAAEVIESRIIGAQRTPSRLGRKATEMPPETS